MNRRVSSRIDTLDTDNCVCPGAPNVRFWHKFGGRLVRLTLVPGQTLRVTVDAVGYHRDDWLTYNGCDVFHGFRRELFDTDERLIQLVRLRLVDAAGPVWESLQDVWRVFTREEAGY